MSAMEGHLSTPLEGTSDRQGKADTTLQGRAESTESVGQSPSEPDLHCSRLAAQASDKTSRDNETGLDDALGSSGGGEGYES